MIQFKACISKMGDAKMIRIPKALEEMIHS
jgi:antitoxin component of MazEF toxin-antitoxin module